MKFAIKSIIAAAAFVAVGASSAAIVTIPTDGTTITGGNTVTGSGTLAFSALLLGALDTGKVVITAAGAATPLVNIDADGYYVSAAVSAPMTSLTIDSATGVIKSAATTGGATQTGKTLRNVSTAGGFITVENINVDMTTKAIYATITGANGVGTLSNFHLWDAASITGATSYSGAPGVYTTNISGLKITTDGFAKFAQAMSLTGIGLTALQGVQDYGSISSVVNVTAVPEPSTYALMGLGLVGISLVARRRAK